MSMRINDEGRLALGRTVRERLETVRDLHAIVAERIAKQEELDGNLKEALDRVGKESTEEHDALDALSQASEEAARRIRLVALKLETKHLEGAVDDDTYRTILGAAFPQGTGAVGGTPGDRHTAMSRIGQALEQHPAVDPGGELSKVAKHSLSDREPRNEAAKKEAAERQEAHEQLGQARVAWDEGYQASKEIVGGLLRDAGRHAELGQLLPDAAK